MKKRIHVLSDLHLEFSNFKMTEEEYDILVLAGDISQDLNSLRVFFDRNLKENIPVVYIMGNHEFEGKRFEDALLKYKELQQEYKNVNVLYNEAIELEGIRFIGSTLWSNFESKGIDCKNQVKSWAKNNVIDFSYIFKKNTENYDLKYRPWTPDDMEKEFKKAYDFLSFELRKKVSEAPKFVITHFAPHKNSIHEKYQKDFGSPYWCNHLEELMGFSEYWVHGHTHDSFNYNVEGTKVICNPRGVSKTYNISSNNLFNRDLIVNVDFKPENNSINSKKSKP